MGPLGKVWEWYQKYIAKKHRGISHWLLIGTLVRIAFPLFLCVLSWSIATIIAFVLTGKPPFFNWLDELIRWRLFWIWLVGLIIGDTLHILMDFAWSIFERP